MTRTGHRLICSITVAAIGLQPVASIAGPSSAPITRDQYEACQSRQEQDFHAAIETLTINALNKSLGKIDYDGIVADEWRRGELDRIVDESVDQATEEVQKETSWGTLIASLADQEQAQEIATTVAERVYRSDAMKKAIEDLAVGVGNVVGQQIELATQDASGPALLCLQAFLGPRYGSTVAKSVIADAGPEFGIETAKGVAQVSPGAALRKSSAGITGAAILLVRRQLANIARRVGQRIAGSILSRLVSVVAGGVGLVLIAKDLWELRNGVLPIIAQEMKADTTKAMVREELAKSIGEQIQSHIDDIGRQTASRVIAIWQQFRSAHAKALELAERHPQFKNFLNTVGTDQLARMNEIVALVLAAEGEDGVLKRLTDGTLNEAITSLPPDALTIARETRSLETALKWNALAGDNLADVVRTGIYRDVSPDTFTAQSLRSTLAIRDKSAVIKIAQLDRQTRTTLLELPPEQLRDLARNIPADGLETLAHYLTGLGPAPRDRIVAAITQKPAMMRKLTSPRVRDAILSSNDQAAAVEIMLRTDGAFDPVRALKDVRTAWAGEINPILIWEKHPLLVAVAILALVALVLMLRRLISPLPSRRDSSANEPPQHTA